jgi:antitoxin (DNA-binding transcriptional repressor) of toxin-antitoxin stability system
MEKVGVRDLKIHASEIARRLREDHESFELTYRGETIGKIVPIEPKRDPEAIEESLAEWQRIIESIAAHRIDDVSAEETMREIRRDL